MAGRGMGWIPDYPDVQTPKLRDYQAIAERIRLNQKKLQQDQTEKIQDRLSELEKRLNELRSVGQDSRAQISGLASSTAEAERRIVFLLSSYEPRILSRGMQSQSVEELQRNLELLGYYQGGDRPSYFGTATEASVRQFQTHQKFERSGVVSPVMWAELIALAEIATDRLQRIFYQGNCGPGILYVEQQLQQLPQFSGTVKQTGHFGGATLQAITAFQTSEFFDTRPYVTDNQKEDGFIGPLTRRAIREQLEEQLAAQSSSQPVIPFERPLSAKTFEAVRICLYSVLCGGQASQKYSVTDAIAKALGGEDSIRSRLRNSAPRYQTTPEDQIKQRIAPLVEVVARLIQGDLTKSAGFSQAVEEWMFEPSDEILDFLQPVVQDAYFQLQDVYFRHTSPEDGQASARNPLSSLEALTNWVENGTGYFASYPFRFNQIYRRGMSNVAVTYLQELLRALGFYSAPITGVFEKLTENALKQFQKQEEIDVDGIVGLDTRAKLAEYKQEKFYFLKSTISPAIATEILDGLGGYPAILCVESSLKTLSDLTAKESVDPKEFVAPYNELLAKLKMIQAAIDKNKSVEYASSTSFETEDLARFANQDSDKLISSLERELQDIQDEKRGPSVQELKIQALPEQLRRLALIYIEVTLYPLIVVISQLLAPMGGYTTSGQGVAAGLRRLKQIAQRSKLDEIAQLEEIAQRSKLDAVDRADPQPQPETFSSPTAIWKRQFQAFVASRTLQLHKPIDLPDETLDEFQPLVEQALTDTFQRCSEGLKRTLQTFLYQDLINLLEDFQHSFEWQTQTIDRPQDPRSLAQLTQNILKTILAPSPQESRRTSSPAPLAERTFVRLEIAQSGKKTLATLQTPVIGKLRDRIVNSIPSQTKQSRCTLYLGLPEFVDLSHWCSPVRDQGKLDSCTAYAGVALTEFFEKKSSGKVTLLSSRFLYKVTRMLMQQTGDTGASIRETMKALVYFGVPPEQYCPDDEATFDDDPNAFCYAFAQNYQTISYFRLDDPLLKSDELLAQIKTVLAAGFPCMFGFSVYDSLSSRCDPTGHIPYPSEDSEREGGHAAIAVGYNDYKHLPGCDRLGAFLIKNSWGTDWGCQGYGWLPYEYVRCGLAQDWWSMIKTEWIEQGAFGLGFWDVDTSDSGHKGQGGNDG